METRLLAKNNSENRLKIARNGAIKPLISLLSSSDLQLQEYGVTPILNLSMCDENKELIASSGAIKPLVRSLKTGTATAKENAACALPRSLQIPLPTTQIYTEKYIIKKRGWWSKVVLPPREKKKRCIRHHVL
ncbi:hypothetical protein ACFX1T_009455 [Malus domestica]